MVLAISSKVVFIERVRRFENNFASRIGLHGGRPAKGAIITPSPSFFKRRSYSALLSKVAGSASPALHLSNAVHAWLSSF